MLAKGQQAEAAQPAPAVGTVNGDMLGLPGKPTAVLVRPLRAAGALVRPAWSQRTREHLSLAVWIVFLIAAAVLADRAGSAPGAETAGRLAAETLVWLGLAVASVELVLAFVEREPSAARLRRALRLAPAVAFAVALVAAALSESLRFAALGYAVAGALVFALVAASSIADARRNAPMLVFALGWALHALGVVLSAGPQHAHRTLAALDAATGAVAFLGCALAIVVHSVYGERSRRLRTQRNLLDSARKYRHVYYSAPVALLSVDLLGQIQRWNDLAAHLFRAELRQGRVNTLEALLGGERAGALLERTIAEGRHSSEVRIAVGGDERICDVDALLAADAIEVSFVDVTERTLLAQTLEHMAYHDALTDRLNLHGLEREIQRVSQRVALGAHASMFYVDLHRFKAVNDVFGHAAGNALVAEVAGRIESKVPDSARIARLGGDEFLVVLPDCALECARTIAQATLSAIVDEPYEVDGKRIRVDASTGVVEFAADMSASELIAYANAACREARKGRAGGIVAAHSSGEHLARYRAEVELGLRLRTSLPTERICVYAQPIVPLRRPGHEHSSMSYEVLLRERDESGNIQPPARLIAAAERHGAMRAIDWYMLERTLEHLDAHREFAASADFVTVNLSGISLNDERFLADAHALLCDNPDIAPRVCLEITESIAMFDMRSTRRFVEKMRSLDVRIALDDFGAGYSSFAYLRELPASLVKIDGQFMPGIDAQPRNQVIVSGIRRLTEELGMACVAEWVEDVAALEFLVRVDMDYAQGFVLAKPQPLAYWLDERVDLEPLEIARGRLAASRSATVLSLREAGAHARALRPAEAGEAMRAASQ